MFEVSKYFVGGISFIVGAVFVVGFFGAPAAVIAQGAQTANLYFDLEKPTVHEGDTFIVNLKINTPDTSINVVDGTIFYDSNKLNIQKVSTGGSLFAFWPSPPVIFNDKGELRFVGGVLDGFQGSGGDVLRMVFVAKDVGASMVDFLDGFSVFLNDGQGTKITPSLQPLAVNILERPSDTPIRDEWQALVKKDTTPPEFVEALISRNQYIFDNQYFVNFFATDKESGVSHYEIQEGTGDFALAKSPHLLKDQTLKSAVQIKVVDNAGNESVITPTSAEISEASETSYKTYVLWILGVLIALILIFGLWRRRSKKQL